MKYVQFAMLCYKAYRGDPAAALQVLKILAEKGNEVATEVKERLDK